MIQEQRPAAQISVNDVILMRLGDISQRMDRLEKRMDKVEEKLVKLDEKFTARMDKQDDKIEKLADKIDKLAGKIDASQSHGQIDIYIICIWIITLGVLYALIFK